jgi:DUF1680 family protein
VTTSTTATRDDPRPLPPLPQLTELERLRLRGDVHERAALAFRRVGELYPDIDDCGSDDLWPGDRSGRIIEALAVLARYLGERPARLDLLVRTLPERLNERGYVGRTAPEDELHTDQLWGNWFQILGLVAYWELTRDDHALQTARRIADALFLASLPLWEPYAYDFHWHPPRPNRWRVYVHPGAGLASGGGLIHLFRATGEPAYLRAARQVAEMGLRYRWREGAHGHSALSILVNLVDVYASTGERRYLDESIAGQRWVQAEATSVNGEPYNLFLPRDTYMEGCGVGDWLVLNLKLWRTTGDAGYLDTAESVLYNALFHVQRPGGSFGCDLDRPDGIEADRRFFTADWCCSMRGARALGEFLRYVFASHLGDVLVNFYAPGEAELSPWTNDGPGLRLAVRTDYPVGGAVDLTVTPDRPRTFGLKLRLPGCARDAEVSVNGDPVAAPAEDGYLVVRRTWSPGDRVRLRLLVGLRAFAPGGFPAQHAGSPDAPTVVPAVRFYHGPLLLGADGLHNAPAAMSADGLLLVPRDGDDLILPRHAPGASDGPLAYPGARYAAVRLKAGGPGGFAPDRLAEQGALIALTPLAEHTGDNRCGPGLRVRYGFDCGLFRDPAGRRAQDDLLATLAAARPVSGEPVQPTGRRRDKQAAEQPGRARPRPRTSAGPSAAGSHAPRRKRSGSRGDGVGRGGAHADG